MKSFPLILKVLYQVAILGLLVPLSNTWGGVYSIDPKAPSQNLTPILSSWDQNARKLTLKPTPGDTLVFKPGIHTYSVHFQSGGTAQLHVRVEGEINPRNAVVFDGSSLFEFEATMTVEPGVGFIDFANFDVLDSRAAVFANGSHDVTVLNVSARFCNYGFWVSGAQNTTVNDCRVIESRTGIVFDQKASGLNVTNFFAQGMHDLYVGLNITNGVYLQGDGIRGELGTSGVTVNGATISRCTDAAIDLKSDNVYLTRIDGSESKEILKLWGTNVVVMNSKLHSAHKQEIAGGQEGYIVNIADGQTTVANCTIVDAPKALVKAQSNAKLYVANSILANSWKDLIEGGNTTETNNLLFVFGESPAGQIAPPSFWSDPLFINWAARDFHLQSNSPALNKGRMWSFGLDEVSISRDAGIQSNARRTRESSRQSPGRERSENNGEEDKCDGEDLSKTKADLLSCADLGQYPPKKSR